MYKSLEDPDVRDIRVKAFDTLYCVLYPNFLDRLLQEAEQRPDEFRGNRQDLEQILGRYETLRTYYSTTLLAFLCDEWRRGTRSTAFERWIKGIMRAPAKFDDTELPTASYSTRLKEAYKRATAGFSEENLSTGGNEDLSSKASVSGYLSDSKLEWGDTATIDTQDPRC